MDFRPSNDKNSARGNLLENARLLVNPNLKPKDIESFYDKWSENYDEQVEPGFGSSEVYTDMILRHTGDQKDIRILDIGAGTGLFAEELRKHGYTNIDGLDPSGEMLKKAQEKKIYKKTFQCFFTDSMECLETDSYDCVVSRGAFGGCYVQPSALTEVIRCVKPGGYVCIISRSIFFKPGSPMGEEMARLENEGKWKKIEQKILPNYCYDIEGDAILFKITK